MLYLQDKLCLVVNYAFLIYGQSVEWLLLLCTLLLDFSREKLPVALFATGDIPVRNRSFQNCGLVVVPQFCFFTLIKLLNIKEEKK